MIVLTVDHDFGDITYFIPSSKTRIYKVKDRLAVFSDTLKQEADGNYVDDYVMAGMVVNIRRYHIDDVIGFKILESIDEKHKEEIV